jgi:hypothetical protein
MAMKRKRATGQEAPMVISPRDVARLLRQAFESLRRKKRRVRLRCAYLVGPWPRDDVAVRILLAVIAFLFVLL